MLEHESFPTLGIKEMSKKNQISESLNSADINEYDFDCLLNKLNDFLSSLNVHSVESKFIYQIFYKV